MTAAALACCCAAWILMISITSPAAHQYPILSGIAHTDEALKRLNTLMEDWGYKLKYDHEFSVNFSMIEAKDRNKYFIRVYKTPDHWAYFDQENMEDELLKTRLDLRKNGEETRRRSHGIFILA